MAPVVPIAMAIGAKVAAGAAAVKGAIAAGVTAVKGLAVVGKVGAALGKIGTAIKASKVGMAIGKIGGAIKASKVGGYVIKGAKAVSGFAKAHPVVTGMAKTAAKTAVKQGVSNLVSNASENINSMNMFQQGTSEVKKDMTGFNARSEAYNNSVFGTAMRLSDNELAGDSGQGSGIFSSLLKTKNNTLT